MGDGLSLVVGAKVTQPPCGGATPRLCGRFRQRSENHNYLKGVSLPASLSLVENLGDACAAGAWLLAVPIQGLRDLLQKLRPQLRPQQELWWACKGLERETGLFAHEIVASELAEGSFRGRGFFRPHLRL